MINKRYVTGLLFILSCWMLFHLIIFHLLHSGHIPCDRSFVVQWEQSRQPLIAAGSPQKNPQSQQDALISKVLAGQSKKINVLYDPLNVLT